LKRLTLLIISYRRYERRKYHMNTSGRSPLKTICLTLATIALAALVNATLVCNAEAHKVNVFAYVEGDQVVVEGYFSGNVKAQNCQVEVFDAAGKKLLEGKTDTKGVFTFKLKELPPFKGGLKIVLNAEMGHRGEYTINESELPHPSGKESSEKPLDQSPAAMDQSSLTHGKKELAPEAAEPSKPATQASTVAAGVTAAPTPTPPQLDEAALRRALEAVLDKKLAPITRMLGNQEKIMLEEKMRGPRMTDIIGGIGWIFGIVGTAAFFWSKKRPDKP
jgi:nickel transport protein